MSSMITGKQMLNTYLELRTHPTGDSRPDLPTRFTHFLLIDRVASGKDISLVFFARSSHGLFFNSSLDHLHREDQGF